VRGAEEEHLLTFTAHAGEVLSFDLIGTWRERRKESEKPEDSGFPLSFLVY